MNKCLKKEKAALGREIVHKYRKVQAEGVANTARK